MRLVGYCRVSTEEQATEGVSLAAQRERIEAYSKLYGHKLVAIEEDAGFSAKSLERPGVQRALAQLRAGAVDGLLVAKLDRLSRSVMDTGALLQELFDERGGRALLSVADHLDTKTAGGRLVVNMLMTVASWEREVIGERTREALRVKKAQGIVIGQVPLGMRRGADGRLVEDEAEQQTLRRIYELADGGLSPAAIARTLTEEWRATKRGGGWHRNTVRKVLAARRPGSHARRVEGG